METLHRLINRIKHWYWWHFKATEFEKQRYDMITFGTGIMKGGKRIDPRKFIANANKNNSITFKGLNK